MLWCGVELLSTQYSLMILSPVLGTLLITRAFHFWQRANESAQNTDHKNICIQFFRQNIVVQQKMSRRLRQCRLVLWSSVLLLIGWGSQCFSKNENGTMNSHVSAVCFCRGYTQNNWEGVCCLRASRWNLFHTLVRTKNLRFSLYTIYDLTKNLTINTMF